MGRDGRWSCPSSWVNQGMTKGQMRHEAKRSINGPLACISLLKTGIQIKLWCRRMEAKSSPRLLFQPQMPDQNCSLPCWEVADRNMYCQFWNSCKFVSECSSKFWIKCLKPFPVTVIILLPAGCSPLRVACLTSARSWSFSSKTPVMWKGLPEEGRGAPSLEISKASYKTCLFTTTFEQ